MLRGGRLKGEDGETLLELLITVVILGIAVVAVAGGMAISIKVSDIHRKEATAASYLRDFAESINRVAATPNGYALCPTIATVRAAPTAGGYVSYSPPSPYSATITAIQYLTAAGASGASGPAFTTTRCSGTNDRGAQQLTLQVTSGDSRATESLIIVIRRPCSSASASC